MLSQIEIKKYEAYVIVNRNAYKLPSNLASDISVKNYISNRFGTGKFKLNFYKDGQKKFSKILTVSNKKKLNDEINEPIKEEIKMPIPSNIENYSNQSLLIEILTKVTAIQENIINKFDASLNNLKENYELRIQEIVKRYEAKINELQEAIDELNSILDDDVEKLDDASQNENKFDINTLLKLLTSGNGENKNQLQDILNNPTIKNALGKLLTKQEKTEIPT